MQKNFNITISSIDNAIAYMDYMKTLAKATVELEAVNMGGQISSIEGAAAQFDLAKKGVDKAIKELETASVPDAMKDFNAEFKKALTEMSATLDGMSTALKAGDIALFESYTSKMESIVKDMENITIPTSSAVTKNIISAEDQKKLDEIPGKLTTEANTFAKKTFAF
ncbi:MAG: hypothetical protein NT039_00155 [Candidatus Berkelbacteria bacterium]|nr:hypothetical protein [Candidatus Berkelbacteria bacterium]